MVIRDTAPLVSLSAHCDAMTGLCVFGSLNVEEPGFTDQTRGPCRLNGSLLRRGHGRDHSMPQTPINSIELKLKLAAGAELYAAGQCRIGQRPRPCDKRILAS